MIILTIIAVGALCIACFFIGAKVGQTCSRGEELKLPNVNLFEVIKEREAKKEAEFEQDKISTIMQNIESYDGTAYGQKDVPRG